MRTLTVIAVGLFFLGASSAVRSEDAKTKPKSLVELCQQYRLQAQSGKTLQPDEMSTYSLCLRMNPMSPSYIDPTTGHFNSLVQNPPSTYRDADGCLRHKTTNMIIECLM